MNSAEWMRLLVECPLQENGKKVVFCPVEGMASCGYSRKLKKLLGMPQKDTVGTLTFVTKTLTFVTKTLTFVTYQKTKSTQKASAHTSAVSSLQNP